MELRVDSFDKIVIEVEEREYSRDVKTIFGSFSGASAQPKEQNEPADVQLISAGRGIITFGHLI